MQKKLKICATPGCDKAVSIIVTHGKERLGYCKACGRKALEDKHETDGQTKAVRR